MAAGLTPRFVVFLLALCPGCFGQTVKIHVVNIVNGRPLRDQRIEISMLYPGGSTERPDLRVVTAANGEAQFELPKSAPTHFAIRAILSEVHWYCDCLALVTTEEVMQKGFMSKSPGGWGSHAEQFMKPSPGEIFFRAQPTPWWVRILYPLMKD